MSEKLDLVTMLEETETTLESLRAKCARVETGDRLMFCISLILGVDWVTSPRASGGLSITTDGFVVSGGLFVGSASGLERNLRGFLDAAEVTEEERDVFNRLYGQVVRDWRSGYPGVGTIR